MSRYGTRATGRPWVLVKADRIRSELPAAAATLSVSGLARASAMNSPSVFTFSDAGADSAITMVVTFVIGSRSRSALYGSFSCAYGCAVKVEAGTNNSVWSSLALVKALMATRPSPPGRFSITTGLPQRADELVAEQPGGDVDSGGGAKRQDEFDRTLRIGLGGGGRHAADAGGQPDHEHDDQSQHGRFPSSQHITGRSGSFVQPHHSAFRLARRRGRLTRQRPVSGARTAFWEIVPADDCPDTVQRPFAYLIRQVCHLVSPAGDLAVPVME